MLADRGPVSAPYEGIDRVTADSVIQLQALACEAVLGANTNPKLLTPEEHARVDELQRAANVAATEANLAMSSFRHVAG